MPTKEERQAASMQSFYEDFTGLQGRVSEGGQPVKYTNLPRGFQLQPFGFQVRLPDWSLHDLIPKKSIGVMYGASNSGKSQLILDLTAAMLSGKTHWMDKALDSGDVLMFAESLPNIQSRLMGYMAEYDFPVNSIYLHPSELLTRAGIIDLAEYLIDHDIKPKMIVFDTMSTSFDFGIEGENSNSAVAATIKELYGLLDRLEDCFIVIVHHTAKNSNQARGASALIGNVDWSVNVEFNHELNQTVCTWEKDRWRMVDERPVFLGTGRLVDVEYVNGRGKASICDWELTTMQGIESSLEAMSQLEKENKTAGLEIKMHEAIDEMIQEHGFAYINEDKDKRTPKLDHAKVKLPTRSSEMQKHLKAWAKELPGYRIEDALTATEAVAGFILRKR